jgi:hypothetical protein
MIKIVILIIGLSLCGVSFWTCNHSRVSEAYTKELIGDPNKDHSQPHTGWSP